MIKKKEELGTTLCLGKKMIETETTIKITFTLFKPIEIYSCGRGAI